MIVTKTELADELGVDRSTVSTWIARGQLSAPALLVDGRVDLELAKQQLTSRVDLAKSRGRAPNGLFGNIDKPEPRGRADGELDHLNQPNVLSEYAERISRAKGDLLQLAIDREKLQQSVLERRLLSSAEFSRSVRNLASMFVSTIESRLNEWAGLARSAASSAEAEEQLRAACQGVKEGLTRTQPPDWFRR